MDAEDARRTLDEARAIAEDAGRLILAGWRTGVRVQRKGRIDLVTEFDLASERLVRARLAAAFPAHAVVGEEGGGEPDAEHVWYVDPLDGTTNFAHGHPFFAVSLGLCVRGAPVLGVVAAPALGVTWSGARGVGAFRGAQPCRVSETAELLDALVATGFSYDQTAEDDNVRETRAFLRRTRGMRRCGAAAIDLAMVADGTFDLYWEQRLNAWDVAAGLALVEAAGGATSDYSGGPADVRRGRVVASNGALHAEALRVIEDARAGLG